MSTRTAQIGHVIQREVAQLFAEALDEHMYGLVTVTRVEVLSDLSEARIYISSLENTDNLLMMLNKRKGFVRRTVRPRLHLKKIPKFSFHFDSSIQEANRIEELLNDA